MKKVVLGLSGGVDSAVSARLLQQEGFEVFGLYMDNGSAAARDDAIRTAEWLNVPLKVLDIHAALDKNVCVPFTQSYLLGETPNPCIMCNPSVKFPSLLALADEIGAEHVATGHYARTEDGILYKGMPANDQSYMLCRLTEKILRRVIFPLGNFEKRTQVRSMAEEMGIPVAHKPDSMEICFIPDKDYISWLKARAPMPPAGELIYSGAVVGQHGGIHRCTVGQRWPGLFQGKKLYVAEICPETNQVILKEDCDLMQAEISVRDFNWINGAPVGKIAATVRVRHTKLDTPCKAVIEGDVVKITCLEPVRAPSRGQSAVLYDGERVLGGGYII